MICGYRRAACLPDLTPQQCLTCCREDVVGVGKLQYGRWALVVRIPGQRVAGTVLFLSIGAAVKAVDRPEQLRRAWSSAGLLLGVRVVSGATKWLKLTISLRFEGVK